MVEVEEVEEVKVASLSIRFKKKILAFILAFFKFNQICLG